MFENDDDYERQWQRALKLSKDRLGKAQEKQKKLYDKGSKLMVYDVNDHVLLEAHKKPGKFNNRWLGPYKINKKISDLNYEIIRLDGDTEDKTETRLIVHVNRLKRVSSTPNNDPTTTPPIFKRRGRPPKLTRPVLLVKRRGRPPKLIMSSNAPKKRGRPRKETETTQPISGNKKRGRPKKLPYPIPDKEEQTTVQQDNTTTNVPVPHTYHLRNRK